MADIKFTISPAPGIANDLIAVIYNTLAPGAEITRQVKNPPHAAPYDFNFPNLPDGTYIVKIHESPDGIILGTLRHDFWVSASINNVQAFNYKTFQVGAGRGAPYYDPAHESTNYINPDLDGLDYLVFKTGYGVLNLGTNIAQYPGGGFSLTDGSEFYQDEVYTILISNLTQVTTGGGGSATSFPNGVISVAGDLAFTSTHYSKVLEVTAVNNCVISIASLDTIPDNTVFSINTHALNSDDYLAPFYYASLSLPAGRFCRINGRDRTRVDIGRGEEIWLMKLGNYLRVLSGGDAYRRVGQIVYSFGEPPLGSLPLIGGWFDKSYFRRIYDEYVLRIPPAELGTGADDIIPDADNRTKWIIGINKFWVPDHGGMFHRMTDTDNSHDHVRLPGSYQQDMVGPGNVQSIAFTGNGLGHNSLSNDGVGFLATHGDGGLITTNMASGTNRNTARTGAWPIITGAGQDGQTRPRNAAINAYILI